MSTDTNSDPSGLGRSALTRWLPVLWQASPSPPRLEPFSVPSGASPARFLLRVILSVRRYTLPAAALGILWQVGEALVPVVMGVAIDRALATGDLAELILWIVALAGVFLMLSLAFRFMSQLTERATEIVQHRLRATLSQGVLHADGAGAKAPDGRVVSLMTNDVTRTAAVALTVYPIAEFAGIVFVAVALLLIHWPLGIGVIVGAPLAVWIMGLLSGRLSRESREYQTLLATTVAKATDLVSGYRVIKGLGAEEEAARRYRESSGETLQGAYRNVRALGRFLVGSNLVSGVFVAIVAIVAGWFAISGNLSVGELIAAVGLSQALLAPMQMLAMNAVPSWAAAVASSGRVADALKDAECRESDHTGHRIPAGVPAVSIAVCESRNETVWPGEFVGIVADERMAADIAHAMLSPQAHRNVQISIEGVPAHSFSLAEYRSRVTASPHHAVLFSGSLGESIETVSASSRMTAAALHAAACNDFVAAADGLDGSVGEMGNRLSGGQRQRVALARALATNAPVLFLHDPTTAVDSVTEQAIASRLHGIRQGRTTIIVASSPALLNACDRVIDLRRGYGNDGNGEETVS